MNRPFQNLSNDRDVAPKKKLQPELSLRDKAWRWPDEIDGNEQIGIFRKIGFCSALMTKRRGLNTETQRHRENTKEEFDRQKTNPGEDSLKLEKIVAVCKEINRLQ